MRLKTPVRLRRGLTMAAAGTVVLGFAGFAVTQGGPASADPHQVYTVVGSDTIQDVYNQFSLDEGANLIGSWNATNPTNLNLINEDITPNNAAGGQCSFSRPNGSTQGANALRKSINQSTTAAQLAIAPGPNCVDWSRSSSAPGSDQKADGQLVFIPFAIDAVTGAVGSESSSAFQTETNLLTTAQLTTLYNTCTNVTMPDGTQLDPNGTGNGTTILNIDLYLPQSGSGTAKFWASKTGGYSLSPPPACDHQTIVNATNPANDGTVVEEHDGSAVSDDPNGYGPFSIAQYIAQSGGFGINRIHNAILVDINSIAPEVNGSLNLNASFTREVYDVIPYNNVTSGMTGFNSQEAQLLAGTSSVLCRDVITISNYGFALLPSNSSTYDACGATTANLRAFDSTDPV
jgi:ABC-type phosphate transport system substrate-binding protein